MRLDPEVLKAIEKWGADEFRSTNGQLEWIVFKALKEAGYATALTGKWHLGSMLDWGPNRFGFDHAYGSLAGGVRDAEMA